MFKVVLVLAAIAVAIALAAPDYLSRLASNGSAAVVTVREQPKPAPAVHGGIVRLAANRSGHYVSEIEINNRPVTAMVDTGATLVALRYEDARNIGVVFPGDKFDVAIRTANGEGRAKRVQLRSLSVGPITLRDVDALVVEQGALGVNLLGMSFLRRLSRFEVDRGTLVLER
ncbi:MAG TPA: TIGR02281 family clan AA aspartic protease [Xanthobacteraceae bacterium]|jgi:aspartyl protease family protein